MTTLPEILIIDDEPDIGEILADFLEDDCTCNVFSDPSEAVKALEINQYKLVITDLNMPKVSGLQIIDAAQKHSPTTPVLVLTGNSHDDPMVQEALSTGAKGVVTKPFGSPGVIIDYVKKFI